MCRCGVERPEADTLAEVPRASGPTTDDRESWGAAQVRALRDGYEEESELPPVWRLTCKGLLVLALAAVFTLIARSSFDDPLPRQGNIRVLARLDEYTKTSAPRESNAIPGFLGVPGTLGVIEPSSLDSHPVRNIDGATLGNGFCSASIPRLVRYEFPGFYNRLSDARLEAAVLKQHPEYHDRVCALPFDLDADADDVVKYELKPRTALAWAGLTIWTLVLTAAIVAPFAILYYRFGVDYIASLPQRRSQRSASLP